MHCVGELRRRLVAWLESGSGSQFEELARQLAELNPDVPMTQIRARLDAVRSHLDEAILRGATIMTYKSDEVLLEIDAFHGLRLADDVEIPDPNDPVRATNHPSTTEGLQRLGDAFSVSELAHLQLRRSIGDGDLTLVRAAAEPLIVLAERLLDAEAWPQPKDRRVERDIGFVKAELWETDDTEIVELALVQVIGRLSRQVLEATSSLAGTTAEPTAIELSDVLEHVSGDPEFIELATSSVDRIISGTDWKVVGEQAASAGASQEFLDQISRPDRRAELVVRALRWRENVVDESVGLAKIGTTLGVGTGSLLAWIATGFSTGAGAAGEVMLGAGVAGGLGGAVLVVIRLGLALLSVIIGPSDIEESS